MELQINEIYQSIQGESSFVGVPCVFIRTMGCSLRCRWCDTEYAFYQGKGHSFEDLLQQVRQFNCALVELTGGEPLDQKNSYDFLKILCDEGYTVLLETGGHKPIETIDHRVHIIMDLKCPSSKMQKHNEMANLNFLKKKDEVKFVIGNRQDYEWAVGIVQEYQLSQITNPLFSPVFDEIDPQELVQWLLSDQLSVRFQLQLHKLIWGKDTQSV